MAPMFVKHVKKTDIYSVHVLLDLKGPPGKCAFLTKFISPTPGEIGPNPCRPGWSICYHLALWDAYYNKCTYKHLICIPEPHLHNGNLTTICC